MEEQQDTKVLACDYTKSCCALAIIVSTQYFLQIHHLSLSKVCLPLLLQPTCCKFSAHGRYIALGFLKGLIQVW